MKARLMLLYKVSKQGGHWFQCSPKPINLGTLLTENQITNGLRYQTMSREASQLRDKIITGHVQHQAYRFGKWKIVVTHKLNSKQVYSSIKSNENHGLPLLLLRAIKQSVWVALIIRYKIRLNSFITIERIYTIIQKKLKRDHAPKNLSKLPLQISLLIHWEFQEVDYPAWFILSRKKRHGWSSRRKVVWLMNFQNKLKENNNMLTIIWCCLQTGKLIITKDCKIELRLISKSPVRVHVKIQMPKNH